MTDTPPSPARLPTDMLCQIAVPVPIMRAEKTVYDYLASSAFQLSYGDIVLVPLGSQQVWGIVVGLEQTGDMPSSRLKHILGRADLPPISKLNLAYLEQLSKWTVAPFGAVMKLMLNCPQALVPPPSVMMYRLADDWQERLAESAITMTSQRNRLIEFMASAPPMSLSDLARESAIGTSVISSLRKTGLIIGQPSFPEAVLPEVTESHAEQLFQTLKLNESQQHIADQLGNVLDNGFSVHLIDGVPGAGKTELYFWLVAMQVIKAHRARMDSTRTGMPSGGQIIIMLPEIVLTTAWQDRFSKWFGITPLIWHSSMAMRQRRTIWRKAIRGEPMVIAGARSLLSLPFADLGMVIVDEEHDSSFKQEDFVSYQARDMALMRAKLHNIPILLASATPSLESWVRASGEAGTPHKDWHYWALSSRFGTSQLPQVGLVDVRLDRPESGKWISPPLNASIKQQLLAGRQSLLFLNRRGYAPMTVCGDCGHRLTCHQCDSLLVTHRLAGNRQCHICGYSEQISHSCPACDSEDGLVAVGPGVERLVEEVKTEFPDARISILSSDSVAQTGSAEQLIDQIISGQVDIIVGTQMAAKGHHFPHLDFVGVIDADLGLGGGDLRAAERTYQLLWQVAGRSGRESGRSGKVLIQTYQPEHPVMQALQSPDNGADNGRMTDALKRRHRFMQAEAKNRKSAGMPPFGRLAALVLSSSDIVKLEQAVHQCEQFRPAFGNTHIYGPAPAVLSRARGQFRMRYLIRADRHVAVQAIILGWLEQIKLPHGVRAHCDIDPYSFM
ncbi:MAG: replication restart helicase PriA [Candidatus Puniceispirillaceae bacterium]|nr:primosomal protein N' [Pseudomonadota bacterium]